MARVQGASAKLCLLKESTYGTAASGNYHQLGFFDCDFGTAQELIADPILGIAPNRDVGDPFLGEVNTAGRVTVPINLAGIGHWLRGFFGAPTTSNVSADYTHVFTSGGSVPSQSIEIDVGSGITNRYAMQLGARFGTLEIDFGPTGAAKAAISFIAQGEVRASSSGAGTPVVAAGANFQKFQGSVKRGGSALGDVVGATITFDNGVEAVRTIRADRKIEGADPGLSSAYGTLTMRYSSDTLIDDAVAGASASLTLALTISSVKSLTFQMGTVFLSAPRTPIRGPQGIEVTYNWRAAYNSSDAEMLSVTLKNQETSYA